MTSRSTWKKLERDIATEFGTFRTPLSGGASRHTLSDTLHDKLYIECKFRSKFSILNWFKIAIIQAQKENKIPILAIKEKGSKDRFIIMRIEDIKKVMSEFKNEPQHNHI